MHDPSHDGFYPLSRQLVGLYIPAVPGAFSLAVRLATGAHHAFYAAETDDLQMTLRNLSDGERSGFPPHLIEYLERFQCYVSWYAFSRPAHASEIEKMLRQSNDPAARRRVICAN